MSSQAAGAGAATASRPADEAAAGTGRLREFWRRSPVKVGALTVAAAFIYCLDSLNLLRRFLATTFDLVIFDQGIRGYAHLAAPVSVARGVSDGQGAHLELLADHWSPLLALLAAVDGAARLQRHWPARWIPRRPATLWAAAICAAALVYLPSSPFGSLLKPGFYNTNAQMRAAAAAVAHVPAGVEVEATNNIGPALSGRDTVLLLDGTPRWAPWVVGDTLGLDFPFCTPSQQAQEVAYLRAHGYAQVYAGHGYVVLHRPADARTAQALAHPLPAARLHTDICY